MIRGCGSEVASLRLRVRGRKSKVAGQRLDQKLGQKLGSEVGVRGQRPSEIGPAIAGWRL